MVDVTIPDGFGIPLADLTTGRLPQPTMDAFGQQLADMNTASYASAAQTFAAQDGMGIVIPEGSSFGPGSLTFAALQDACSAAASEGKRVWAAGEITTSSTLVVTSDADLGGLTINYTGSDAAVQLGVTNTFTFRLNVRLPKVIAANKGAVGGGWGLVAGTVGVRAVNLNSCSEIVVPHIQDFETGLLVYGQGEGNSYNNFLIGHLSNNKVNLKLDADATGWANQNQFYGGRYSHESAEGTNVSGVRQILMVAGIANPINTNVWVNPSLEGETAEYIVDFAGTANVFVSARFEATGPRVRWQNGSTRNLIMWGYNTHQIVETFGSTASTNTIMASTMKMTTGSAGPLIMLENATSSANPALAVMEAAARAAGSDPATAYAVSIAAQTIRLKRAADANARLTLDCVNGRLYFANGTSAPAMYWDNFGSTGVRLNAANLVFGTDNTHDIGAAATQRPRYVRIGTAVQTGAFATGSRPTAATAGAGAMVFDTTLNKPIWSTGAAWVDATGTTV